MTSLKEYTIQLCEKKKANVFYKYMYTGVYIQHLYLFVAF